MPRNVTSSQVQESRRGRPCGGHHSAHPASFLKYFPRLSFDGGSQSLTDLSLILTDKMDSTFTTRPTGPWYVSASPEGGFLWDSLDPPALLVPVSRVQHQEDVLPLVSARADLWTWNALWLLSAFQIPAPPSSTPAASHRAPGTRQSVLRQSVLSGCLVNGCMKDGRNEQMHECEKEDQLTRLSPETAQRLEHDRHPGIKLFNPPHPL